MRRRDLIAYLLLSPDEHEYAAKTRTVWSTAAPPGTSSAKKAGSLRESAPTESRGVQGKREIPPSTTRVEHPTEEGEGRLEHRRRLAGRASADILAARAPKAETAHLLCEREREVLLDRERREHILLGVLPDTRNLSDPFPGRQRGHVLTGDVNRTGVREEIAADQGQERRLSGAVGAHERDDLTVRHAQRNIVDREQHVLSPAPEPLRAVREDEVGVAGCLSRAGHRG
jgi:hypothetical protein